MQAKVTEEGKTQAELYDKFMCYCKTNGGDLSASIQTASAKIDSLTSSIKEATEKKAQTEADLQEHTASRAEAKDTMAQATALRQKEAAAYAKVKSDSETNLAALAQAITALERGVAGAFLQTTAAAVVRKFAVDSADLPDATREEVLSFLSGGQRQGYIPQSGEITGILKQMQDEMSKNLGDATADEQSAIQNYEALLAAKKKEVASLQKQIEGEMTRTGNLGVALADMSNDLVDTKESLSADEQFKMELSESCDTKAKEWEVIKSTRADELLALAETIKVLNDDDALDLFKSTLPSASVSLVQIRTSSATVRARALSLIHEATKKQTASRPELDLISLALRGQKVGFDKIIRMIDQMVVNLKTEQQEDDSKREYCNANLDKSDDKKKSLELSVSDSETAIKEMKGAISELTEEMSALEVGIKALDKAVAEATALRKEENADFKELMTSDSTAKEVLGWAKNRLNKFYDPKLYKPPPAREMTEEERITVNMGGTLAPVTPGGIAGTGIGASLVQISAHSQHRVAPPPPPETFGAYSKKTDQGHGVVAMIDLLIKDLDKEMQEATVNEKEAQAEYEKMMEDSAAKRAADSKSLTQKTSEKASTQEDLQGEEETKANTGRELMGTLKYISSLHGECDWLLQYHQARKEARAGEVESLMNAKAALSGADYSLLQQESTGGVFMAKRVQ
jgi:septal ring factor EnvC (AmiA/AmiB activator)